MILTAFRRKVHNRKIHALYGMIVAQARSTVFYTAYGVPDTVEGRFELIVLHLVLVLNRLGQRNDAGANRGPGGNRGAPLGQRVFDVFCRDLDDNLREMGVGDLAVPRQMRRFGEAFYGRQGVYCAALKSEDNRELEKALARNIFAEGSADRRAGWLAAYTRALGRYLDSEDEDAILSGAVSFPSPMAFADV
jgi:cytochrome b pre-mRNA-processing protein 3